MMNVLPDTENIEVIENQPFHYILKILSGPHMGAEIILSEGGYTLGKSDQCDLILQDEMINDSHAQLTVHKNGLVITQLTEQGLLIDGEPTYQNTPYQFQQYQLVALGGTRIVIGQPGVGWEQVEKKLASLEGSKPKKNFFNYRVFNNHRVYLLLIFLLIPALAISLVSRIDTPIASSLSTTEKIESVQQIIVQAGASQVKVASPDAERIVLSGYVDSELQVSLINTQLVENNIPVELNIISAEYLVEAAGDLAASLGFKDVLWVYISDGQLKVDGYVNDRDAWEDAKRVLQRDIAGLQGLDDSAVEDIATRRAYLKKMLVAKNLDKKLLLSSDIDNSRLVAKGAINEQEAVLWSQALKEFRDRYSMPEVHSDLNNTKAIVDLKLKAVYINGRESYIVLEDDKKYLEGAYLDDGYQITKVALDKLVLLKDGNEYEYLID